MSPKLGISSRAELLQLAAGLERSTPAPPARSFALEDTVRVIPRNDLLTSVAELGVVAVA